MSNFFKIKNGLSVDGPSNFTGAITGSISSAISASYALTASYALNGGGGGASVTISGSVPTDIVESGSLWWNEVDGNLYIQVESPTGSVYVPATNTVAGGNYGATLTTNKTGSVWNINHNLNTTTPLVTVYSGSSVMIPEAIQSLDANNSRITFNTSVAGTAVLSTGIGSATAELAETASFATTASFAESSSYSVTASYSTTASFAESSSYSETASFSTTASFSETASFAETAGTYKLPNSSAATWVLLGTWNTSQNGATLYSRIVSHAGYNANAGQNQVTELHFKTSNGSSSQPGVTGGSFLGDALAYRNRALGTNFTTPETIRIVQINNNRYQVYGFFNASFIDNSTYYIQITNGTTWTNSSTTVSAPTGTFINVIPSAGTRPAVREYRRSQTTGFATGATVIVSWDIQDINSIENLTHATGVFTNTANYTRTFTFDYQSAINSSTTITEHTMFLSKNGTPTNTNRVASNTISPVNSTAALKRLSATVTLAPNDTIRCYVFASTTAGTWTVSPFIFGVQDSYSTRLTITEL